MYDTGTKYTSLGKRQTFTHAFSTPIAVSPPIRVIITIKVDIDYDKYNAIPPAFY